MEHEDRADRAKQRLEASRRALMHNMVRNRGDRGERGGGSTASDLPHGAYEADHASADPYGSSADAAAAAGAAANGVKGLWRTLRRTARAWWRSHPAHLAVEVGEPLLSKYAAANPMKLLAVSALLGGAVIMAKPWRLISLTGLLIAALRSTPVSGLMASLLASDTRDPGRTGRH